MKGSHFFHRADLVDILERTVDKTLGQVDVSGVFVKAQGKPKITGIAGDVIEQSVLGFPADQAQRPDLDVDGTPTELKTTGMRLKQEGGRRFYEAKEPASITAVSLNTIAGEQFLTSAFWHKAEHMLFVFYQYESDDAVQAADYADFHIRGYRFHRFSPDDQAILAQDWQIIHDFVAQIQRTCTPEEAKARYPDLSTLINRQTTYLDTAPKYPHPPRFRLRKRVVSAIIQETFQGDAFEKLPDRYLGRQSVEDKCAQIARQFYHWSMADILDHFGIAAHRSSSAQIKQYAEQVIVRMFGGTAKKMSRIELFQKFGYIGKAVTLTAGGGRTEDTKLFSVDLDDLTEPLAEDEEGLRIKTFEDSELYSYFQDSKLLCVIFQEELPGPGGRVDLRNNRFLGFKILDLNDDELLAAARRTWTEARRIITGGELTFVPQLDRQGRQRMTPKTGIPMGAPNLPKAKDHIVFFRGTGQDARDKISVLGVDMLRQSYWLRGSYLVERIQQLPFIGGGPGGDHETP